MMKRFFTALLFFSFTNSLYVTVNSFGADETVGKTAGTIFVKKATVPSGTETKDEKLDGRLLPESDAERATVERFWKILVKSPKKGTAFDRVYGHYVDTGQYDALVRRCDEWAAQNPADGRAQILVGMVAARHHQIEKALGAFTRAAELDSDSYNGPWYRAELLLADGQLREAAGSLETALARKPLSSDLSQIMETLGRIYERLGEREKSKEVWDRFEMNFPDDLDIRFRIAESMEEEGDFTGALARYEDLIQAAGKDSYARVRFTLAAAEVKIRIGDRQGAIGDFENLLDDISAESWLSSSVQDRIERVFQNQADDSGLADYYRRQLEKHPQETETARRLAAVYLRLGQSDQAKTLLVETAVKAPSDAAVRLALIGVFVHEKNFAAACDEYRELDRIEPGNPDHLTQWGLAALADATQEESARRQNALTVWKRLLDGHEEDPVRVILLADLLAENGFDDEARSCYEKGIELRPDDPGYREYLAHYFFTRQKRSQAVAAFRPTAEGENRTAGNLRRVGDLFLSFGYDDEGFAALRDAVSLAPDDFEENYHFAEELLVRGGHSKTADELRAAVETVGTLAESDEDFAAFLKLETKSLQMSPDGAEAVERWRAEIEKKKDGATARDFWRLAAGELAFGKTAAAGEAMEKGIALAPDSVPLLQAAADLATAHRNEGHGIKLLERLARLDPSRRSDALKKIATLQLELGEGEKAVETARLVLASGENPENGKFYADILMNLGKREDGIVALRRTARLHPEDGPTLFSLASALTENGQWDDALDILWRLYDKTDDIQEKMGIVSRLADVYQQGGNFDHLIARLRQDEMNPARHRVAVFALAQAYLFVNDFYQAHRALETLVSGDTGSENGAGGMTDGKARDADTGKVDKPLLTQLVQIAEAQGDFETALRYQTAVCGDAPTSADEKKLMELLQMTDRKDEALALYLKKGAQKENLGATLNDVDRMLASEDDETAEKILAVLDSQNPGSWEILYRRGEVAFRLGHPEEADAFFAAMTALSLAPSTPSAVSEADDTTTIMTPDASGRSLSTAAMKPPTTRGEKIFATLWRENDDRGNLFGGRRMRTGPKPHYEPKNFGDALEMVRWWGIKAAIDRGMKETPPTVAEAEAALDSFRMDLTVKLTPEATPDQIAAVRRRLDFETVAKFLNLSARKREVLGLTDLNDADPSVLPAAAEDSEDAQKAKRRAVEIRRIEGWLGLHGEAAFVPIAADIILKKIIAEDVLANIEMIDLNAKTEREADPTGDNHPSGVPFSAETHFRAEKARFDAECAEFRNLPLIPGEPASLAERIEWLFAVPEHLESLTSFLSEPPHFTLLTPTTGISRCYPLLRRNLEKAGYRKEAVLLDRVVEKGIERSWQTAFSMATMMIPKGGVGEIIDPLSMVLPLGASGTSVPDTEGERAPFLLTHWVDLGVKSFLREDARVLPELSGLETQLASVFMEDLYWSNRPFFHRFLGMENFSAVVESEFSSTGEFSVEKLRLTKGEPFTESDHVLLRRALDQIDVMTALYLRYEESIRSRVAESMKAASSASNRASSVDLGKMATYFTQTNGLALFQNWQPKTAFLQTGGVGGGTVGQVEIPPLFLSVIDRLYSRLDYVISIMSGEEEGIAFGTAEESADSERIVPDYRRRFRAHLAEIKKDASPTMSELLTDFLELSAEETVKTASSDLGTDRGEIPSDGESFRLFEKACEEKTQRGEKLTNEELLRLAVFCYTEGRPVDAVRRLDEMTLCRAAEIRGREETVIVIFQQTLREDLKERVRIAAHKMEGFRLADSDLMNLRTLYRTLGDQEKENLLLKRLLTSVSDVSTQHRLLNELRNAGEEKKEITVPFALKVYRSLRGPFEFNDIRSHTREQAMTILQQNGKLDEVAAIMEKEAADAVGSIDLKLNLADVYLRAGKTEEAKKTVESLADKIPNNPASIRQYAGALAKLEMKEEAVRWYDKLFSEYPEKALDDLWNTAQLYREIDRSSALIRLFQGMDPSVYQDRFLGIVDQFKDGWLQEEESRAAAVEFWKHCWNLDIEENRLCDIRQRLCQSVSDETAAELYPLIHDFVIGLLLPDADHAAKKAKSEKASIAANPGMIRLNPVMASNSPLTGLFTVWGWSNDSVNSTTGTLLRITPDPASLLKEVRDILARMEADPEEKHPATRYTAAKIMEAMILFRTEKPREGFEIVRKLATQSKENDLFDQARIVLDAEMQNVDDPEIQRYLVEDYKKILESNRGGYGNYLRAALMAASLKTGDMTLREEIVRKLSETIETNFKLAQRADANGNVPIHDPLGGIQYRNLYEIMEETVDSARELQRAGRAVEFLVLYRRYCEDRPWFVAGLKGQAQFYYQQLRDFIDQCRENVTLADYLACPEVLVPMPLEKTMPEMETDGEVFGAAAVVETTSREMVEETVDDRARIRIDLAVYTRPGDDPTKTVGLPPVKMDTAFGTVGSYLLDVLRSDREKNPERFRRFTDRLAELAAADPENRTFTLGHAFAGIAAGETDGVIADFEKIVSELETTPNTVGLGANKIARWILFREILDIAARTGNDPLRDRVEKAVLRLFENVEKEEFASFSASILWNDVRARIPEFGGSGTQ